MGARGRAELGSALGTQQALGDCSRKGDMRVGRHRAALPTQLPPCQHFFPTKAEATVLWHTVGTRCFPLASKHTGHHLPTVE